MYWSITVSYYTTVYRPYYLATTLFVLRYTEILRNITLYALRTPQFLTSYTMDMISARVSAKSNKL